MTAGEKKVPLYSWTGKIKGKVDKYIVRYMGREYQWSQTPALELMTVANQLLFFNYGASAITAPRNELGNLARDNAAVFRFALGVLFRYNP